MNISLRARIVVVGIALFAFCESLTASAQQSTERIQDSLRANELFNRAWDLMDKDIDSALYFASTSLAISDSHSFTQLKAYALSLLGTCYSRMGQYDSAVSFQKKSLLIRLENENSVDIASCYNNLGLLYHQMEQLDSAIYFFDSGIDICREQNALGLQATLLNGLGMTMLDLGQLKEAEKSLTVAISIGESRSPKDLVSLAKRYQNLGRIYERIKRYDLAREYFAKAKSIYEMHGNHRGILDITINDGVILLRQGDYSASIEKLNSALVLCKHHDMIDHRSSVMNTLGYAYLLNDQVQEAERLFLEGIQLAIESGMEESLLKASLNLANLYVSADRHLEVLALFSDIDTLIHNTQILRYQRDYLSMKAITLSGLGRYKEAYETELLYKHVRDSIAEAIDEAQISLGEMERHKRDELILKAQNNLRAMNLVNDAVKASNRNLVAGILILALVAATGLLILRNRSIQLKAKALAEKKKSDEKVMELLAGINAQMHEAQLDANKETSSRIGQDLHDSLGSKLAVVQTSMEGIRKKVASQDENIIARFDKVEALLEQSCSDLRSIAHDLQDKELGMRSLEQEIEQFSSLINQQEAVNIQLKKEALPDSIRPDVQKEITAVARLLIENVLRHAKAKNVTIELGFNHRNFLLSVSDDGIGFLDSEPRLEMGRGLKNAHKRADKFGGEFSIRSQPGQGTKATLRIPMATI